jgi:hypothetical protein
MSFLSLDDDKNKGKCTPSKEEEDKLKKKTLASLGNDSESLRMKSPNPSKEIVLLTR